MKGITKFLSAAVALTALVSCADDLELNNSSQVKSNADLVATLDVSETSMTRLAAEDNGGVGKAGRGDIVWSPGEQIRVFTLDQLSQDLYELTKGAGATTGEFKQIENNDLTGDKYAITEADMIYGVSADGKSNKPLLTLTLPHEYTPGKDANGNQKFPVPFWGAATVSGGSEFSTISTKVTGLTAFLRVNLAELPVGTKYIVLTTHGGGIYDETDGFMLAPMGAVAEGNKDVRTSWYKAGTEKDPAKDTYQWITGGYSEPLSGTLNATLEDKAELAIDKRLVYNDEIIVNLTGVKNQIFYIPIVCNQRDEAGNPIPVQNLHVIAASTVSKKYRYCYAGTELRVFQQQIFKRNTCYYLDMSLVNAGKVCIGKLNQLIAQYNQTEGLTTIINVDKLEKAAVGDHTGHTDNKIVISGKGKVVLNIKEIGDNDGYGTSSSKRLLVTDNSSAQDVNGVRTAQINVPSEWDVDGDGTPGEDAFMQISLGNWDAILGTVDGVKAAAVDVLASTLPLTKFEGTYNLLTTEIAEILPEKKAALKILNGFKNLVVNSGGDIYATNSVYAQEETEIDFLYISTANGLGIRLDDTLVKQMKFSYSSVDRQVFTTGSSAIAEVYTWDGVLYETPATKDNTPGHVIMRSYWTGKALSKYAIESGYDVKTVYTVAQLASIGEGLYPAGSNGDASFTNKSNHAVDASISGDGTLPKVSEYNIPTALVRMMWLGADTYPWIGARVRVKGFKLDGENVELKNMNMLTEWPGATTFVDDPHWCCTSCWTPDSETPKVNLQNGFGLIRYIINDDEATVTRVNLNEIKLVETDKDISFVGGIAGYVQSGEVDFNNNAVGECKINVGGKEVGGMIGYIGATGKVSITKNEVTGLKNNSGYIESRGIYDCGGLIGGIDSYDDVLLQNNTVQLAQYIKGKSYVGGLVGYQWITGIADTKTNKVYVTGDITATDAYYSEGFVGGIFGYQTAYDGINTIKNTVSVKNIIAEKASHAGGIVGIQYAEANILFRDNKVTVTNDIKAATQFAGGISGKTYTDDKDNLVQLLSESVKAKNIIANDGFVGGEIGQADVATFEIGYNQPTKDYDRDYKTVINITKSLAGKYAVGGLVGNNAQSSQSPLYIFTGQSTTVNPEGTAEEPNYFTSISIAVKSFAQTRTEADFAVQERQYFGTMSNILGYQQDYLKINQDKTTKGKNYPYLMIEDNLDAAMKEAVLYKLHADQEHNLDADQAYWGDKNGYVGWRATGAYWIGNKEVKGEQLDEVAAPGHNLFYDSANYLSQKSKYQN